MDFIGSFLYILLGIAALVLLGVFAWFSLRDRGAK